MQHATSPQTHKIAYLDTHGIAWLDASGPWFDHAYWATAHAGVVLAPSEKILMLSVQLPLPSQRQRRSALPFAVEAYLAEPLSSVHVALGPEIADRHYLSGVVRHELMVDWIESLKVAGLSRCRIVPDVLVVPKPPDGAWSVWIIGTRALVRKDDGSGFALNVNALPGAWKVAGQPPLIRYGEELPEGLPTQPGDAKREADSVATSFDLRQGIYAGSGPSHRASLKVVALLLVLGLLGHGVVATIDTLALQRIAEDRRAQAQVLLREIAPHLSVDGDMTAQLARLMPSSSEQQGRFLPLFARISETLQLFNEGLSVQTLTFNANDNTLSLDLQASDLAALQRIEAAFSEAGLQATSGVATAGGGGAQARIVINDRVGGF